jgi:hypothetical protein
MWQVNDACSECGTGKYKISTGNGDCTLCAAGKASSSVRATSQVSCVECSAGSYSSTQGKDTCDMCPSGRISGQGATSCSGCDAGKYPTSSTACAECEAGKYSTDGSVCESCPQGKSLATTGATALSFCSACNAGFYADSEGSASCSACNAGKYSGAQDIECSECAAGSWQESQGSSDCVLCPAGTYLAGTGASSNECAPCAAGLSARAAPRVSMAKAPPCVATAKRASSAPRSRLLPALTALWAHTRKKAR